MIEDLIKKLEEEAGPEAVAKVASALSIPELVHRCGTTASEHGFHEAHKEEALKALRNIQWGPGIDGEHASKVIVNGLAEAGIIGDPFIFMGLINTECAEACEAIRKGNWTDKDGAWEELADVFIRAFDFIFRYGPDHDMDGPKFFRLIKAKMAKNESRPYLHGKRF